MSDLQQRSVFVGNIPYDTTEQQMIELFSAAGTVENFRIVHDRETGKPKGYGFCEYQDVETAQSAVRNFRNLQINGRPLRIGFASGSQMGHSTGNVPRNPNAYKNVPYNPPPVAEYSPYVEPEMMHDAISKTVSSLPPEQMFELMKQMKLCIQNNPSEAKHLLMGNPQLAYALLQAQVVMKIIDPKTALSMLHSSHDSTPFTELGEKKAPEIQTQFILPGGPHTVPPIHDYSTNTGTNVHLNLNQQQRPPQPWNVGNMQQRAQYPNPNEYPPNMGGFYQNNQQQNPRNVAPRQRLNSGGRRNDQRNYSVNPQHSNSVENRDPRINRNNRHERDVYRHPNKRLRPDEDSYNQRKDQSFKNANQSYEGNEVLSRIMAMSEQEIMLLPADQRDKLLTLRNNYLRSAN